MINLILYETIQLEKAIRVLMVSCLKMIAV